MSINRASLLYKFANKANREALKASSAWEDKPDLQMELYKGRFEAEMKAQLRMLDCALQYDNQLEDVLSKYGYGKKKKDDLGGNWLSITLRPGNEHSHRFTEFKTLCEEKYLNRAFFIERKWCWEQKGETPEEMGKGYHIHILAKVKRPSFKTELIRDTFRTFKKFLLGEQPDAFIKVKYVDSIEYFNNLLTYMDGIKSDIEKEASVAMDKPWRAKYGLNDWYGDTIEKL